MSDPALGAIDFRQLFGMLPTAVLVLDPALVIVEVNDAYVNLLDRSRDELLGRPLFDAFPFQRDDVGTSPIELSLRRLLATAEPDVLPLHQYDVLDVRTGVAGRRFWSTINAPVLAADGSVTLIVHKVEDVTEYVRLNEDRIAASSAVAEAESAVAAELYQRMQELRAAREAELVAVAALRAGEARARAVLDTAVDAIVIFDRAGLVESMNRSAERMFGRSEADTVGSAVSAMIVAPDRTGDDPDAGGDRPAAEVGEMTGRRVDGSIFPIELAISDAGPDTGLFTAVIRDISERKRLEAQLAHQSAHDALTGLANRRQVLPRLEHELARMKRHPGVVGVLFIDLDGFKAVNDDLGHAAGDALLVAVADRLRLGCRVEDLVARLGGDEFVVVCAELSHAQEAEVIARRLERLIDLPMDLAGHPVQVRASIGIVTDDGGRTPDQLLAAADAAMYGVKRDRQGRS